MNEQLLHLDISKRPDASQTVRIGQGDVHGTTIVAEIFDNDVALDMSGKTARFLMRQPGGHDYVRDTNCTVSGNRVTYVVDESHVGTAAGYTDTAYFEILSGSTTIASTQRFRIEVLRHAMDGATPAQSWDTEIDELIQRGEQAVSDAEQAVGDATSAIDAANQAIARIEPTIEQAAEDAAEQATADAEQRIQDAIDAMGDISELAVPEMSADVRGGAKLEQHGGLALRDGALGIGSLVQESDGYARGGLAEVTAKGHAEQVSTTGKNLLPNTATSQTINGVTFTVNADGSITVRGTAMANITYFIYTLNGNRLALPVGSYVLSDGNEQSDSSQRHMFCSIYKDGVYKRQATSYGTKTFAIEDGELVACGIYVVSGTTIDATFYPQLELGSMATEYEPYTGGAPSPSPDYPQEIQVVRGRNLYDPNAQTVIIGGHFEPNGNIEVIANQPDRVCYYLPCEVGETYTATRIAVATSDRLRIGFTEQVPAAGVAVKNVVYAPNMQTVGNKMVVTQTAPVGAKYVIVFACWQNASEALKTFQLTLGSTPQPYVPYGHVGMEARDPDTDELISCTALPLPSRGWVAGLRDGTADSLTLDGAGKCEWTLNDDEVVFDGSNMQLFTRGSTRYVVKQFLTTYNAKPSANNSVVPNGYANRLQRETNNRTYSNIVGYSIDTQSAVDAALFIRPPDSVWNGGNTAFQEWLASIPLVILFQLATPVTEDCGYVDMPAIPSDATVTIPELDALGIKYFVDDTVTQYGREIYARANSEYEDRITALEQAVAELATS